MSDAILPGYSKLVKRPMDMLKMERKLMAHEYRSVGEFDRDVRLMVRNCTAYHGKDSDYTKVRLSKYLLLVLLRHYVFIFTVFCSAPLDWKQVAAQLEPAQGRL